MKTKVLPFKPNYFRILLLLVFLIPFVPGLKAQQNLYEFKIGHPRIMMTKYDELALRFIMMEDPVAEKLLNELKKDADDILNDKDVKYTLDENGRMLSTSRLYLKRIITLSLAYRLLEVDKYSDKAIDHMLHVASYPNWNPEHFLDVAEMTAALAIGYDWNFYHLNIREKEIIRNGIVELGLKPGLDAYRNPGNQPNLWYQMNNSWNQVCAGGLILGALAVGEDFPDLKNNIIYNAIKNLVPTIDLYQPDGVWFEGHDYWEYATSYLAMTLSSLNSALEHDFGLSRRPGIDKTALYYVNSVGPTGQLFNYADVVDSRRSLSSLLFWFSKYYYFPEVAGYYKNLLESNLTPGTWDYAQDRGRLFYLSLAWFDDGEAELKEKPRAQQFNGLVDILVLQGNGRGENALYLAAKGGKGILDHQQLDAGSFVIDSNGERWALDLGSENEELPNIHQKEVGGQRWSYYRNTNKSHNTLVIDDALQLPGGESKIIEFNDVDSQPFGIMDLTEPYKETEKVERGFKLLSNDQILIRDEILFSRSPKKIRWAMMTDAEIELLGDKVTLSRNGKKFMIQAFADKPITFKTEKAKEEHSGTKDNTGKNLLYFMLNEDLSQNEVNCSVVLGNYISSLNITMVNTDLADW